MKQYDPQQLIEAARAAADRAYCPYSSFKVGAALLTSEGNIVTGCNIENASYGLSVCAERVAVGAAAAAGSRSFVALAVVSPSGPASPCGACRQFLLEFGRDIDVIFQSPDGIFAVKKISDLLPDAFRLAKDK